MLGLSGSILSQLCLFGPGCLLILAVSPFWLWLRELPAVQKSLPGINASAAGMIFAAVLMLYQQTVKNGANAIVVMITASIGSDLLGLTQNAKPTWLAPLAIAVGGASGALMELLGVAQKVL